MAAGMIDGNTTLIAHLGYPTGSFKAPLIYNPYFASIGVNAVVVPMGVQADAYPQVFAALFRLTNIRGALVTMPHKVSTLAMLDEVSTAARIAGACNAVLRRPDGRLVGDMFDGEGFVRGIRRKGCEIAGRRALVVGAGGVGLNAIRLARLVTGQAPIVDGVAERRMRVGCGSAAVGIFAQGDSIANRQTLAMVNAYLAAWGVSPNWIGTLASSATLYADDASGPSGECREGWAAYGDYLGFDLSDGDVPGGVVPVDGVAAYMAVGKMARMQRQPFLNTDLGAGSAAPIVTVGGVQHRYDLAFYRTRFGLPLWDVHLLNPGMNDYLESPANYRMALGAMIAEARRAAPLAHIVLWQTVMPNTPAATLATAGQFGAVRQTLVELHRELSASDPKLHLCSAWAHQTAEGWPVAADAANALGVSRATMPEWIHPGDAAREQHAFALACTIANLILGNF